MENINRIYPIYRPNARIQKLVIGLWNIGAQAHATGYDVKVCKVCNSTIDRKHGFDFDIQLSVS